MAASSKKTFIVTKADGEEVEVSGTRTALDNATVTIYDGDEVVASFRGYQNFYLKK